MRTLRTHNPADESFLKEYQISSDADIDTALADAHALYAQRSQHSTEERQAWLLQLSLHIEANIEKAAKLATEEMGKPIREARAELQKSASVCRYYAEHAAQLLAPTPIDDFAEVLLEPIGPILAIMPWNFPFWQLFRILAPAIALGNPVVLKHAENVSGCALLCQDIVREAKLPHAVLQTLIVPVHHVQRIIEDPRIAGVTLTGSERAGRIVAAQATQALKPVVLELGGSDPFIVLADADLPAALDAAVRGRFQNSGQSCIAAKRIIVEAPLYDRFVRQYAAKVEALVCDNPIYESTQVGPLARADLLETLERQVAETIGYGARCVTGGRRRPGRGFFFEPTVLAEVTETMPAFREEIFGPVASITVAKDHEDAIRLANATPFGLGASLWCESTRGRKLAHAIQAGTVAINCVTASDPRTPFGGTKHSGFGRELGSEGLRSFANIKTVLLD